MPLPVTNDRAPDLLEGHEPRAAPRWRIPRPLLGSALVAALVGGAAFVAAQDDSAAVVDATGSMVLDEQTTRLAAIPHSTQQEGRDAVWTGFIQLDLPDRRLDGEAVMRFSWASTAVDDVVMISHSWGQVDVTFGATSCTGPFAKSSYREPRETGGSLSLRCDDGSLLAATLLLERDEEATADHPFRVFYTLEDGSYVAG
jgi:hypothetical protein